MSKSSTKMTKLEEPNEDKSEEKSEDDENDKPKVVKKKESKVESYIESKDSSEPKLKKTELDVEDPMKDKNRMKILKKIISHLCLLVLILGVKSMFLGLFAYIFYDKKTHLVIFGGICGLQLIGAPIGWLAIEMGNRLLFLVCFVLNLIWIICTCILIAFYWISGDSNFKQEIELHVGAVFFLSGSVTLAICCLLMMNRLDMINIQYKKPEVYVSAEGKASEKAKLKVKKT